MNPRYLSPYIGRGVPIQLAGTRRNPAVALDLLPPASVCSEWYRHEAGRRLTDPRPFAVPPYADEDERHRCEAEFHRQIPDIARLLDEAVNMRYDPMQHAVNSLRAIIRRLL